MEKKGIRRHKEEMFKETDGEKKKNIYGEERYKKV